MLVTEEEVRAAEAVRSLPPQGGRDVAASLKRTAAAVHPQIQNDPEGGIPSGSLEVLGGLTKPYVSFIGGKFFRLMLCFVSIVSSAVTLPCPR